MPTKFCLVKAMVFPVAMYGVDYKESRAPKNWCFWTVALEKTLESPLDCKEIQPVHPKGDQSWVFIVGTDVEAETPILWPPDAKSWLIGKDPDAGKDRGQEEKGRTEDEMVGWHHLLDGHGFGWTLGVGNGQGGLACLWFMGLQGVGYDWATELNWIFTFIKSLFSSSSFSARRVMSSAYLRLLIFLRAILIPACASSSPTFHVMYSQFSSVQFSHSVLSDSLQPHESQHARPPCPSPSPGVHSNSRPSSWWCHPAISSSVIPFSSCPQSLPASESFPMSQLFTWGGQSTGASALASFLAKNTQGWSPLGWTGWISLQSMGLSRVFSNTTA